MIGAVAATDDRTLCYIVGADYYVPDREVSSTEIEQRAGLERLGIGPGTLAEATGVQNRRYAADDEHPSTMATIACERLLKRLQFDKHRVTALLFAANTMDEAEPITAMRVHESLDLPKATFVADVRDACNSALKAMILASGLIRSGMVPNVLIAVGERLHDGVYTKIRSKSELVTRYLAGLTLGDAGAAILMTAEPTDKCLRVIHQQWEVDSQHRDLAKIEAGGTRHLLDPEKIFFVSNAKRLCQVAVQHLPRLITDVCGKLGWELESIGVIPHQVSKGVTRMVATLAGIPLKNLMITLDQFGNTGAATIPMALALAFENGFTTTFRRILLVGGAAGFSAAILALEFITQQAVRIVPEAPRTEPV